MYIQGYLQGSENGRVVTIASVLDNLYNTALCNYICRLKAVDNKVLSQTLDVVSSATRGRLKMKFIFYYVVLNMLYNENRQQLYIHIRC